VLAIANLHNSIGRFYETYTSSGADCHTVNLGNQQISRIWYRPNPPVNGVKWCIRSNINFQQSGVLVALKYVGDNKQTFLENYVAKAERMIRRGQTTAPYAYVVPRGQRRAAEAADLVDLFRRQGTEIHVASSDFTLRRRAGGSDTTTVAVKAGDWVVRMDQPYTQTVRTLLAIQNYKPEDPQPYDDTGWTLDALRHVETIAVQDSAVLSKPLTLLNEAPAVAGKVNGNGPVLLVRHLGDWRSAVLPWKVGAARVAVADSAFSVDGTSWPAGTFIVNGGNSAQAVQALGLEATAMSEAPAVNQRPITLPRVAMVHTWRETQNEGWVRYAFDVMGVPYTSLADQRLREPGALDRFDVVVFPHVSTATATVLNGLPMVGPPIPWKKSSLTPNLGLWDETDDIRPGLGLEGAAALRRFVERGGLLLVEGATSRIPVTLHFTPTVTEQEARTLRARGAVFRAQTVTASSPILYGYERSTFPVYFNQSPVLSVAPVDTSAIARGRDRDLVNTVERQRAKVILRFHEKADSLLISGSARREPHVRLPA
jgi:hypothetical protein